MNTPPDFSPMTPTAKQKTLDHYTTMLREAEEYALTLRRLDSLSPGQRANELAEVLRDIARVPRT